MLLLFVPKSNRSIVFIKPNRSKISNERNEKQ